MDQIDLLREQQKILSGEVALHTSALKRLSEEAAQNPRKEHPQVNFFMIIFISKFYCYILNFIFLYFLFKAEMSKLNEEIRRKNEQIASLGKQIGDCIVSTHDKKDFFQESQVILGIFLLFIIFLSYMLKFIFQ